MPQTAAAIKSARLWPGRRRPAFIPANSVCTLPVRLEGAKRATGSLSP